MPFRDIMAIRFYRVSEPYGCFSNFSPHPITLDDKVWPTSEHYFQAQKFPSAPDYQEQMRNAARPHDVAEMGRDRSYVLRPDWDVVKDDFMRLAVLQKFAEHREIRSTLFSTGSEALIEATSHDYYWGEGTKQTGKNMLGIILMEVREALRGQEEYLTCLQEASSPMHADALANRPNPAVEYQQAVLRRLCK